MYIVHAAVVSNSIGYVCVHGHVCAAVKKKNKLRVNVSLAAGEQSAQG